MNENNLPGNWYQKEIAIYLANQEKFIGKLLETNLIGVLIGNSYDTGLFFPWSSIQRIRLRIAGVE